MACLYVLFVCSNILPSFLFSLVAVAVWPKIAMITDMFLKVFAIACNWEGAS